MWEMMDYARARKVSAQYDIEDLERDLGLSTGASEPRRTHDRPAAEDHQ